VDCRLSVKFSHRVALILNQRQRASSALFKLRSFERWLADVDRATCVLISNC
jgi:phage terminase Nu1 subunit (DNA packaging protein)